MRLVVASPNHVHSAVFTRFDQYTPHDEPVSFAAGGYRGLVDRVE